MVDEFDRECAWVNWLNTHQAGNLKAARKAFVAGWDAKSNKYKYLLDLYRVCSDFRDNKYPSYEGLEAISDILDQIDTLED